jgi:DNA-binding Lrp family transcriptional regulator
MDQVDEAIVALLREDARRSYLDIGRQVHLSAPAVKRRVDRLERDGVILSYTAIVDPTAFGWNAEAFVDLYCEGDVSGEAIKRVVEREPGVLSAHTVAGEASALLATRPGARHQEPRAGARANPRRRWGQPDGQPGGAVHAVCALMPRFATLVISTQAS